MSESPADYATKLADALAAITQEDFGRLCAYARSRLFYVLLYIPHLQASDLITEAIVRTLDGRRKWDTDYPLEIHLWRTADSIAWELGQQHSKLLAIRNRNRNYHEDGDVDRTLQASQLLNRLMTRLAGDTVATNVLNSRLEGFQPNQTCQMLNITDHVYQAARKRIVRAFERIRSDE